jgi:putative oxidoreductase
MRIVSIIVRYLLGLLFTVLGLNEFLNFIHQLPLADLLALRNDHGRHRGSAT